MLNAQATNPSNKGNNQVKLSIKKKSIAALAILGAATIALTGCSAPAADTASSTTSVGLESGFGKRAENRNVYFFTYYNPAGDAFWAHTERAPKTPPS